MYFVIRFHNWGGMLNTMASVDKKLEYIELYDNLLNQLDESNIDNKDMIRQEI